VVSRHDEQVAPTDSKSRGNFLVSEWTIKVLVNRVRGPGEFPILYVMNCEKNFFGDELREGTGGNDSAVLLQPHRKRSGFSTAFYLVNLGDNSLIYASLVTL
jgi:hypothetical protein